MGVVNKKKMTDRVCVFEVTIKEACSNHDDFFSRKNQYRHYRCPW